MNATCFKLLTILGISAGLVATSFAAEDGQKKRAAGGAGNGGDRAAWFDKMDTNGDGKITQAEAPAQVWERLAKADKNGDGAVAKSELPTAGAGGTGGNVAGRMAEALKKLDANGDGNISKSEAGERWERLGRLDKNDDGSISLKDELVMARGAGAGGTQEGAGKGQMFARADKNGDKKLTKDELPAEAWERMSKLDKNGDNAIDESEIAAMRDQVGNGGGGAARPGGDNSGKKPKRPEVES
ncbi:MAG: hypothetical protein AAF585_00300 [Verrucomicrobiota bacterium]